MSATVEEVLILFIFAVIGYSLSKAKVINSGHASILASLLVYVFLPSTAFESFATNLSIQNVTSKLSLILMSLLVLVVIVPIAHFIGRYIGRDRMEKAVYSYSLAISNYGYTGLALVRTLIWSIHIV